MGGRNLDIGVLFADVRGFTSLAETMAPDGAAALLDRFYDVSADALVPRDAIIDKFEGDAVIALFLPQFRSLGDRVADVMVSAAQDILTRTGWASGHRPWLDVGIGLHFGPAYVGNVGAGEIKDFTAVGDVVNTAERLQREAGPGQIVLSEEVYGRLHDRQVDARPLSLQVKGRAERVRARRIQLPPDPLLSTR